MSPVRLAERLSLSPDGRRSGDRLVPEEHAVALTYNGSTYAVMMASPCDLVDFGLGFSLTEEIVEAPDEIEGMEVVPLGPEGSEVRMWIAPDRQAGLARRRRRLAGPVGCGLCGVESVGEALRRPRALPAGAGATRLRVRDVLRAVESLSGGQRLHDQVRALHAAALWSADRGLVALREDVGRHNALDKLVGAAAAGGASTRDGVLVLTSRVSIDLVAKAARLGAPVLVALSAPTAAAIRSAHEAGLTLVAGVRADTLDVYTHPDRLAENPPAAPARTHLLRTDPTARLDHVR